MSDNKKYYYLKLKDNFFDDEAMILLESMPDGYKYSAILLKMYLRSLKYDGKLMFNDVIPYTSSVLAKILRHTQDDVEGAIKTFQSLGLVEVLETGEIYMLDIQNFIGASSTEADRIREYRSKIAAEKENVQMSQQKSFVKPMKNYVVTSEFGWRESPMGGGMEFHNAIDLANGGSSPIYASGRGKVVTAGANFFGWYGNYVVIEHPDGLYTGYAHLSQIDVVVGQEVNQGQQIGLEGATGPVTGPHLHFQFMKNYSPTNGWPTGGDADFINPREKVKL
ncbi:phage replisome organizer N-terminal domain-containing protein [Vagococcus fluvialis]|uniref:phage replisome organizer N-terminal domain-containing protein n=1 Tax=Vagococcus fluvialis TaxID=2738 RepID=UPI003B5CBABC